MLCERFSFHSGQTRGMFVNAAHGANLIAATRCFRGKTEPIGGVTSTFQYTYDTAGRLTAVTENGSTVSSYCYDS